jgi:hypothetical protein
VRSSVISVAPLVHQQRWAAREQVHRDLFGYVEGCSNRQLIHSALGDLSPQNWIVFG